MFLFNYLTWWSSNTIFQEQFYYFTVRSLSLFYKRFVYGFLQSLGVMYLHSFAMLILLVFYRSFVLYIYRLFVYFYISCSNPFTYDFDVTL